MKKIAFSGTLDPITNGHMWVIEEARALANEVVVFISENPDKKPLFCADQRKAIVEASVAQRGWTNVSVIVVRADYTARAAKRHGVDYLIRGIRNTSDFDYENLIQQVNVDVLQGTKTVFVMPPRDLGSVSSSFVRGLQGPVGWHWSMRKFVPEPAYAAWLLNWLRREWDKLWPDAAPAGAPRWFDHLVGADAWGAPQRHYHNLDHLVHGLSEITSWAVNTGANAADVATLRKAFWFHDAVYGKDGALSDEEQSARLWLDAQLDATDAEGPAALIRATEHLQAASPSHPLCNIMQSVDLAILGQPEDIYDAYARNVRAEYAHVADDAWRTGRVRVLQHFLTQAQAGVLYPDPYFASLYLQQANINLARELAALTT